MKIVWEKKAAFGCEYFKLADGVASGTVIYQDGESYLVNYSIELEDWVTKRLTVRVDGGASLELESDGRGRWFKEGEELAELNGAIDPDIQATPFTNTLPINRNSWEIGEEKEFQMVYVEVPSLQVRKAEQRYTYLGEKDGRRVFQYQSGSFDAEVLVDGDGFVVEYPGLFGRRYSKGEYL
ncbi:putative glycolipid-binding domain-containing protein [Metabacillus sp. GX 13764]|uniref:putative glycolipid-binding domain-containing protein n=1 Tax=Metabacillus kandeliae TaxID=2900151 RepID=UPI001E5F0CB7|nr:putative glycolipid-binding domain-containing protein [Metabacillus kandeliae]MCD7034354.1 putative glycolipid-binding domain-containing protein [Metabacillus kandeliae]